MRIAHEYGQTGALTYLAAWDVHRATLFGRCEPQTTIAAIDRPGANRSTITVATKGIRSYHFQ